MGTLIIAEAGVNHNGDMDMARGLIDVAADAGADLVKFQTFTADSLVTPDVRKAAYQEQNSGGDESQHAMLRRLELSREEHRQLIGYCETRDIGFFSTGFDAESVDMLLEFDPAYLKIPSGELTNLPFLRHIGACGKKVILSTGMATMADVAAALAALVEAGTPKKDITVLHCTTAYPTAMQDVNLRAMRAMGDELSVAIGYSDHTPGIEVATAAVALGAQVIEKHFTLDRDLPGPDHKASLEPDELAAMVEAIRNIETALGDGQKRIASGEAENVAFARKSLVASEAIRAGEVFTADNVTVMRPGTGVSPMRWDDVMGQTAARDFEQFELIEL